tara:strand:- start:279 stop:1091 length:813 start_codon:yes stop_codon:yes gene_type:complete
MNTDEAIKNYYKLKGLYYSKYNSAKSKIIKTDASISEKKARINNIKLKCVKCQKNVGTMFYQDKNILIAKCGSEQAPCKLDIRIDRGSFENINTLTKIIDNDMETAKRAIIEVKMKLLFGLLTEEAAESVFEEVKSVYKSLVRALENVNIQTNQMNSVKVEDILENKTIDKGTFEKLTNIKIKNLIGSFKEIMNRCSTEMIDDKRLSLMNEAMELYTNDIQPLLKQQRESMYSVDTVIEDKDLFLLKSIKVLHENMEFELTEPEVISNKK